MRKYILLSIAAMALFSFSAQAETIYQIYYVKMAFTDIPSTAYIYDEEFGLLPPSPNPRRTSMIDFSKQGTLWLRAAEFHAVRRTPEGEIQVMNDDPRYTRMNHHMVMQHVSRNKPRTETLFPSSLLQGQRLFGAGQEFTDLAFPEGYAYKIDDGFMDVWDWHWHNFGGLADDEEVYIQIILTFDNDPKASYSDVNVYWYDFVPIQSEFCVPAGPFEAARTFNGFPWRLSFLGVNERRKVVAVIGHMHDHAAGMQLVRNGQVLYTFTGEFGDIPSYHRSHEAGCQNWPWQQHEGNLISKTVFQWVPEEEIIFEPNDTIMSRAFYTNPHAGTLDAMAIPIVYYEVIQ